MANEYRGQRNSENWGAVLVTNNNLWRLLLFQPRVCVCVCVILRDCHLEPHDYSKMGEKGSVPGKIFP